MTSFTSNTSSFKEDTMATPLVVVSSRSQKKSSPRTKKVMAVLNNVVFAIVVVLMLGGSNLAPTALARKQDHNVPHEHRGKLTPYSPGPFTSLPKLEEKDEKMLENDKPVMKQIPGKDGGGGSAICVQDVKAPRPAVWNQILNLNDYVGKVQRVKECRNYEFKQNPDGTRTIKTKMVVGVLPGYSYEYYCDHTYDPTASSMVWSLDYDKKSDFDDVAGHWHLEDHPTKKECTRVFYACDIMFKSPVPGPVRAFLQKAALKSATSWVKKESEAKPNTVIPAEFGTSYAPQ